MHDFNKTEKAVPTLERFKADDGKFHRLRRRADNSIKKNRSGDAGGEQLK
jgi:hypothetical protein